MSAAVGAPKRRAAEEEIIAVGIARVHGEVPDIVEEVKRAVEIGRFEEKVVLPVEQDIAQIEVALQPVIAVKVVGRTDAHEIVEVHLIARLILLVGEVELVRHLVRKKQRALAGLVEAHRTGLGSEHYGGEDCH